MTELELEKLLKAWESQMLDYDRNTFLWGPEHGDPILAKDLSISHLCNIINWILDRPDQYGSADRSTVLAFMKGEAEYRRLRSFVTKDTFIIINDDGRAELVTPQ